MNERFGKKYKLCSKKIIDEIFANGATVKAFPFLLRYIETDLPEKVNFQIVISVPKRNFKKAVDRNRLKRLIREAVRKKKHLLEVPFSAQEKSLALFLIYTSREEETYQNISNKIEKLFLRLVNELKEEN